MINSTDLVAAAQYKESRFIEGISNSKGLPFHQGIARSRSMCEAAPNKGNFPTCVAAEGFNRGAMAVFLEEPESYACFRPICGKAHWFGFIKDVYSFINFFNNH